MAAPVHVQAAERAAAALPHHTVPEWAELPEARWRTHDGAADVAAGVRVLPTPGHTPGHQSVVVRHGDEVVVLAGQCAYTAAEVEAGVVPPGDAHDPTWHDAAVESLHRLRDLRPTRVLLAHDAAEWRAGG